MTPPDEILNEETSIESVNVQQAVDVRRSIRIAQVLQVLSLSSTENYTIEEACKIVGLSVPTYYRYLKSSKGMMVDALEAVGRVELDHYLAYQQIKSEGLAKLLLQVRDGELLSDELVRALRFVSDEAEKYEQKAGHRDDREQAAREFLDGPTRENVESRMTPHTVNVKPKKDGSVDVTVFSEDNIVEQEFHELID